MSKRYRTAALDSSTWPDFAALVEANNGIFGGCWCMGFHPKGLDRQGDANRLAKERLVKDGEAHAALVFDEDVCVGWVQYGRPVELPRLKNQREYEKQVGQLPDWRIGCCFVGKGHRRAGVSAAGLDGALRLIAKAGGGVVEGYPEDAANVPAGFLFHGALSSYDAAGFTRDRMIGKHRWVVTKKVRRRSTAS